MPKRGKRSQLEMVNQINMTPMVDLVLVLLIIFMITAPLLEYSIDVSPPKMNADKLPDDNTKVISLNKKGQIVFNKENVSAKALAEKLDTVRKLNPKVVVLIRADGTRQYNEVMEVMKAVRTAGILTVGLVTEAEK
ncbi:MAG: biopolymer transporter ExbD [Victivallales bacterium]